MKPNPEEILRIYHSEGRKLSFDEIFQDLQLISQIKKCSHCGCHANTLKEFEAIALKKNQTKFAEKAQSLAETVSHSKKYECINCEPCYPADISNLLFEVNENQTVERTPSCCSASDRVEEKTERWPVEKGQYLVGNAELAVAVCTLGDNDLPERVHGKLKEHIAIVGYCETENIGVEKVVKNLIANAHVRHLILCGRESGREMMGHLSGQALLALHERGISGDGRIIGAKGRRPILKNLSSQQIEQFQSQIDILDLMGANTVQEITNAINVCLTKRKNRFTKKPVEIDSKKPIVAKTPKRFRLDQKGFFVILPNQEENKIYVEHYKNSGELLHIIVGTDAASICNTIIQHGYISQLDHVAYLSKELTRAEYSLKYDFPYRQDKALGNVSKNGLD